MQTSEPVTSIGDSDVAIVGMSGRFPGAENVDEFWENLRDGVGSISFFSEEELTASGVPAEERNDPNYVNASGILAEVGMFDAHFFGYSANEAALMDPQHRLFLEQAWLALENAGWNPDTYPGLIGVYAGATMNTYLYNNVVPHRSLVGAGGGYHTMIAGDKDFLATKVSYKLNLKGPSVTVQTACSTSLVAVHLACQSLRSGECDAALAGGVSVRVPHRVGYLYQEGIVLSPDGYCRAFDADAAGTVIGNGVGVVVLKLLSDALADGDRIRAVIKGSAVNNDGALKAGYTAPNLDAQAAVIAEAQGVGGVAPDTITYVEAHGTGTPIGDPIEVAALTKAFRQGTDGRAFCAIGSVKTNIGHLDAAAGVAGLIKTVLALEHRQIPPSLNYERPNPRIDFGSSPFYVNAGLRDWKTNGVPRRAGVSSFGIGGTNAHVVVEQGPDVEPGGPSRAWQVLPLSAKTATALQATSANLAEHLAGRADADLADVAYTLHVGRKTFEHRQVLICRDTEDAVPLLRGEDPTRLLGMVQETTDRPVAFMFSGQGAQYVDMGLGLYQVEPAFRHHVDGCCEMLHEHLGFDLHEVLYPTEQVEEAAQRLEETAITQPAIFTVEYALARLWMTWGVKPVALIGHSIGEYTAACLAGVFSLEDALVLVAARGRLMQQMPPGAMLSVPLSERDLQPLLGADITIGTINGPARCAVSGPKEAVEALRSWLAAQGIESRPLHTSHAFHSAMMDPMLEPFTAQVRTVALNPPQVPCISNVSGTWLTAEEATDPVYWAKHLRQTVRFAEGVGQLMKEPDYVLLEIGPGRMLTTLATRHPERSPEQIVLSSIRHPKTEQSDAAFLLTTLGKLWLAGVRVDWAGFHEQERRLRVPLPPYPFERQRYWLEPLEREASARPAAQPGPRKSDVADWFYVPSWKRVPISAYGPRADFELGHWLLFADEAGVADRLTERLRDAEQNVVVVRAGAEYAEIGGLVYALNPASAEDYDTLLADLDARQQLPQHIVHLWNVGQQDGAGSRLERLEATQNLGFYSLLFLAQALGKQNVTETVDVTVVCSEVQQVIGEETVWAEKATLLGPITIIPHEHPHVICRAVDVELSALETDVEGVVGQVLEEVAGGASDIIVAYRGRQRWMQTYEPVRVQEPEEERSRLKERGVYLVTGGLGGMGLTLAEHLAQKVQARLVLLGRSEFPEPSSWEAWLTEYEEADGVGHKIRKLQALEALGAEVMVVHADVADEDQVRAAVGQALERFGRIDGVIHAAGVPGGGMMQLRTREAAARVLSPKVRGTLVLAEALREQPLDFFLLCSSINSVVGRMGQVAYSAANAFLDAFAHENHSVPMRCVNWETWREVGMAARVAHEQRAPARGEGSPSREVAHPLLDRCIFEDEQRTVYVTEMSVRDHWVLHEHGIMGRPTLPGTTYLEMARAALEAREGDGAIEMRDVTFLTPLVVEGDGKREVRTVLKKREGGYTFSVTSQAGDGWVEHAKGAIGSLEASVASMGSLQGLSEVEARCGERVVDQPLEQARLGSFALERRTILRGSPLQGKPLAVESIVIAGENAQHQTRVASPSIEFGPRWHSLKWVGLGAREGLALLELRDSFEADLSSYKLHPALLDFSTSFLRLFQSEGSYLPLSYKRLRMRDSLPRRVYSHARFVDGGTTGDVTLRFNVTLFDEAGNELVAIEEFAVIRVDDVGKLDALARGSVGSSGPSLDRAGLLQRDLDEGLSPAEGVAVFDRVVESALPQLVISTRDLAARIEESHEQSAALLAGGGGEAGQRPKHPRPQLTTPYAPARNEIEQKLVEIWQDVLGIEQVGVYDRFFDLGGDSLLVTQIHSRFHESFEVDVSVASLLQYPTIADLVQSLDRKGSVGEIEIEQVQERTSKQKQAMRRQKQRAMRLRKAT
jgi:acyl transferase domain-containing protein/acyl carrier protein